MPIPTRWTPILVARMVIALAAALLAGALLIGAKPWEIDLASLQKIRVRDYMKVYFWWAGALQFFPLTVLWLSAPLWVRPLTAARTGFLIRGQRSFWVLAGIAMLIAAWMTAPRLGQGLGDDEEYATRRAIVGAWEHSGDEGLKFKPLPWRRTLWGYTKPTNHILQSILSRISNSVWLSIAHPRGLPFSETALRLPAFLAGLAVVGLLPWLLLQMGQGRAGVIASFLLALHPWFLEHVPLARGYALVFLFLVLLWIAILRITQTGAWKWWILLGVAEFCLVYTWPAMAPVAAFHNACLVGWIFLWSKSAEGTTKDRNALLGRWLAVSCAAGMAFLQLILPCLPQFRNYLKIAVNFPMGGQWMANVLMKLLGGAAWRLTADPQSPYLEYQAIWHGWHGVVFLAAGAALILLGIGLWRLVRSSSQGRLFALFWLLPGPIIYLVALGRGLFLFEWYLVFAVPGLAALIAMGMAPPQRVPGHASKPTWREWTSWIMPTLLLLGFALFTQTPREVFRQRPSARVRDSVLLTRPSLNPFDPANRNVLTASILSPPEIYDPLVKRALTVESLAAILREADQRNVPLFLNQGYPLALRTKYPGPWRMTTDPDLFEVVAVLHGTEAMFDRIVYRYRPGAIAGKDLTRYVD